MWSLLPARNEGCIHTRWIHYVLFQTIYVTVKRVRTAIFNPIFEVSIRSIGTENRIFKRGVIKISFSLHNEIPFNKQSLIIFKKYTSAITKYKRSRYTKLCFWCLTCVQTALPLLIVWVRCAKLNFFKRIHEFIVVHF